MNKTKLFKKVAAGLLSGILACTMLPTFAATSELQTGDCWSTLFEVNMQDFTKIEGSGGAGVTGNVKTTATVNGVQVKLNTSAQAASLASKLWYTGMYSNFSLIDQAIYDEIGTEDAPEILGGVGDRIMTVRRKDVQYGGDWASPKSGIWISNIFPGATVYAGDKIKVTAWVYSNEVVDEFGITEFSEDQTQHFNTRMWVCRSWQSVTDTGYNSGGDMPAMTVNVETTPDKWTEVTLEYTITEANKNANELYLDCCPVEPNTAYPNQTYFAGAVIQKMTSAGGSYTGGYQTEEIFSTNIDGFEKTSPSAPGTPRISRLTAAKDVDGTDVILNIQALRGSFIEGFYGIGTWSQIMKTRGNWSFSDTTNTNKYYNPIGEPKLLGDTIIMAERKDVCYGGDNGHSSIGFDLCDCYGNQFIEVGDKIRITAWVYGYSMIKSFDDFTVLEDQNTECDVRMWVNAPWESDVQPGYNAKAEDNRLSLHTKMKGNEWTKLVLEYTLTEDDLQAGHLSIDNMTELGNPYPRNFALGAVMVERVLEDADPITGTITIGAEDTDENTKIIVVGYVGGALKACQIIDYVAGQSEYEFEFEDLVEADSVKAYVWNLNATEPITEVLNIVKD